MNSLEGNVSNVQNLKGSVSGTQGLNGSSSINVAVTPNIGIGSVTTLEPNESVRVELDESSTRINPILNFSIPKGATGEQGKTGNSGVYIGETEPTDANVWIDPTGELDSVVLYKNSTNYTYHTTNAVLNDNYTNYDCLEIYARNNDGQFVYSKVDMDVITSGEINLTLSCARWNGATDTFMISSCICRFINNNQMSVVRNVQINIQTSNQTSSPNANFITILKVVGHKKK